MFLLVVELEADLKKGTVSVKQLGTNSSALDGIEMIKDRVYTMKSNSTLQILTGSFPQKLKLEPISESVNNKERAKSGSDADNMSKSKEKSDSGRKRRESADSSHKSNHKSSEKGKGSDKKSESTDSSHKSSHKSSEKGKGSDKKRSLDSVTNDVPHKRTKYDNNGSAKSKEQHNSGKKRSLTSNNETVFKKPKLSDSFEKHKNNSEDGRDEEEHVSDISAKLAMLKSKAKTVKTPTKNSPSPSSEAKFKLNTEISPTSNNNASSKETASESKWEQYESLYVYTTKGLESRSKVRIMYTCNVEFDK